MRFKGPLADSYLAAVALVVCALIPYLALTSATTALTPVLSKSLHLSPQALQLTSGMANAAYAFGTVLAVQFAVHLPARRMLVTYAALFVIGSVMAATALSPGLFIAGHIIQGLTTSLMLIAAVPPLIIGWPTSRMPYTAVVMNLCIFGAVAAGPVIGGVQAGAKSWHALFWIVAGLGALALLMALLTFEDQPPQDDEAPWDWVAITLAGAGCAAAFFGASELQTHRFLEPLVLAPLLAGLVLVVSLVVYEGVIRRPLMPVRQLLTTFPVAGVIIAMSAGAASVAAVDLVQQALAKSVSPTHLGMLFWPEFGGAVLTAVLFGAVFRTRMVPVFAFAGTAVLTGGAAVLTGAPAGSHALVAVGAGLVGVGVGASVSPALFITGFSIASAQIQRVFALVELLRGVAAFMIAPVLLHVDLTVSKRPAAGAQTAIWVCLGLAAAGGLLALLIVVLGRPRLQAPNLERWDEGEEPAWESPPLAAALRGESPSDAPSAAEPHDSRGGQLTAR